jgi:cation diffusion facilitator family transporter
MPSRRDDSLRTVAVALVANLATALAKVLAALFTGSSAMWAEAFHAFADSGNQVLLLLAQRRSGRPPDEQHPLGHGRAAYFWALIAAMGVFAIGAVLSVHQGIDGLVHRQPILSFRIAYLVLFVSFCLDGVSLVQAQRQLRREAKALERTFLEHLDLSSDPVVRAVFAEDAAALVGNLIAAVGIALHQITASAISDGMAAIMVGILLGFVAFQLAARNGDILIGGQVSAALRGRIGQMIVAQPGIVAVTELVVTFIGPRQGMGGCAGGDRSRDERRHRREAGAHGRGGVETQVAGHRPGRPRTARASKLNGSFSTLTGHAVEVRLESPSSCPKDGPHDVGTSCAVR